MGETKKALTHKQWAQSLGMEYIRKYEENHPGTFEDTGSDKWASFYAQRSDIGKAAYAEYKRTFGVDSTQEGLILEWKKNKIIDSSERFTDPSNYLHFWYGHYIESEAKNGWYHYNAASFESLKNAAVTKRFSELTSSTEKSFQLKKGTLSNRSSDEVMDIYSLFGLSFNLNGNDPKLIKAINNITEDINTQSQQLLTKTMDVFFSKSNTKSSAIDDAFTLSLTSIGRGAWRTKGVSGLDLANLLKENIDKVLDGIQTLFSDAGIEPLVFESFIGEIFQNLEMESIKADKAILEIEDHDARTKLNQKVEKALKNIKDQKDGSTIDFGQIFESNALRVESLMKRYIRYKTMIVALEKLANDYDQGSKSEKDEAEKAINNIVAAYAGSFAAITGYQVEDIAHNVVNEHEEVLGECCDGVGDFLFKAIKTGGAAYTSMDMLYEYIPDKNSPLAEDVKSKKWHARSNSKNDITVVFGKDGSYSTIGLSIKKADIEKSSNGMYKLNTDKVHVLSGQNFLTYLRTAMGYGGKPDYIQASIFATLASRLGTEKDGGMGEKPKVPFNLSKSYKTEVEEAFRAFKTFFIRSLAFDFLAGSGKTHIDEATVMVLGGKLVPMYEIARQMMKATDERFYNMMIMKFSPGGRAAIDWRMVGREEFQKLNTWNQNTDLKDAFKFSINAGTNRTAKFMAELSKSKIEAELNFNYINV